MGIELRFKNLLLVSFVVLAPIFFPGCGLDVFVYLDSPYNPGHTALYTSSNGEDNYFWIQTAESSSENQNYINAASDFKCLGTAVYYKIYNSHSRMLSVESTISSLDASTSSQTTVADKLIDTYGYKPLKLKTRGLRDPLIQASGTDQYVYLRLNKYGSEEAFSDALAILNRSIHNLSELTDSETVYDYPRRYINDRYGFNFCEDDKREDLPDDSTIDFSPLPISDDEDVDWQTTTDSDDEGKWFVDMYAVTVGRDATFTYSYSRVLFLGSITIDQSAY